MVARLIVLVVCAAIALGQRADAQTPIAQPAIEGLLAAFDTRPLVALGDWHGVAEEGALYAALVRDPRFAGKVGNVVVEFGGAAHQDVIDRYVAGQNVPYAELRKVWTNTVGWAPTVKETMYPNFFAAVRAANQGLPSDRQIRVWLGEPTIDWSKIRTQSELEPYLQDRDPHAAALIKREILAKGEKALVIYGWGHFRGPPNSPARLDGLVEKDYPNSFYVVIPYTDFVEPSCTAAAADRTRAWNAPALVTGVKGSWLETEARYPRCTPGTAIIPPGAKFPPGLVEFELDKAIGLHADAVLYLGPIKDLSYSPTIADLYLDADYVQEISRRSEIFSGSPMTWTNRLNENLVARRSVREKIEADRAAAMKPTP